MNLAELVRVADVAGLTGVERDTVARLVAGETTAEIARADGVSDRAVRYRVTGAIRKLAVASSAQAVVRPDEGGES